jgi:hypothetical protein
VLTACATHLNRCATSGQFIFHFVYILFVLHILIHYDPKDLNLFIRFSSLCSSAVKYRFPLDSRLDDVF